MSAISTGARRGETHPVGRALERHGAQMAPIIAGCLAVSALTLLLPVHADLRPVGVDPLGPGDRPPRPRDRGRPVVEAVPDLLHRPVLVLRPGPRALPVAVGGARGRPVRLRDGLPDGVPADAAAASTARSPAVSAFAALLSSQQVRARRGARQLRADARGRGAVGVRAPPRRAPRPRALPRRRRRRCCARRRGRSSRSTASGCGSTSRACGCGSWRSPCSSRRAGSCRSGGARATRSAPARARTRPTRAARRSRRIPALELFKRFAESTVAPVEARERSSRSASPPWRGGDAARRGRCSRSRRSASPGSRSWPR